MPVRIQTLAELPDELARQFADGNGVIWTGAGVSARRTEPGPDGVDHKVGVPGAWALEQHFRKRLGSGVPNPATLETLSMVYENQFGRDKLDRLLNRLYGLTSAPSPRFYSLIGQLPSTVRSFITTNYDPFLERALGAREPVVVVREHGIAGKAQHRPHVYKVHGDGMTPRECVITSHDYIEWERKSPLLLPRLAQFFLQQVVVAVGYRAQDGHFLRLLDSIAHELARTGQAVPQVVVVIPTPRLEDFAQFHGPDAPDLVLVPATGDEFLEWLSRGLVAEDNRRLAATLSALIDPPSVQASRLKLQAAAAAVQSVQAHDPDAVRLTELLAEARLQLADALEGENRLGEALRERASAASLLRSVDQVDRADAITAGAAKEALERCFDADLAGSLIRSGTTPLTLQPSRAPFSSELQRWDARTDVLSGLPQAPTEYLDALSTLAATLSGADAAVVENEHAALSAAAAISLAEFAQAALYYARVGNGADEETQIRGWLCHGLAGAPADALRALQRLEVHERLWPLQLRSIGWVAGLAGEYVLARDAFLRAAGYSSERADPEEAAIAFWGAAWAGAMSPSTWLEADPPSMKAYRLQERTRMQNPSRQWSDRLLEQAEAKRGSGKLNEAWHLGLQAWRLSHELLDPRGVGQARLSLARTLLETAAVESDELTWFWLFHWLATARAELSEQDAATARERLRRGLVEQPHVDYRLGALARAVQRVVSPAELRSALMLLTDVADLLPEPFVELVCLPLIRRALPHEWTTFSVLDLRTAACALIRGVAPRLPSGATSELLQWMKSELRGVISVRRNEFIGALTALIDAAGSAPEIWIGWDEPLLWALDHGMGSYNEHAVRDALSRLIRHAPAEVSDPVARTLRTKGEAGDWACYDCLAAGGREIPMAVLDDFLTLLIARAAPYRRPPGQSVAFGIARETSLMRQAHRASPERFRDAVEAVADVLRQPGQWSETRLEWLGTLFMLVMDAPSALEPVLPAILDHAEVAHPNGAFPGMSNHTLSYFRMNVGTATDVQRLTVDLLGYALGGMTETARVAVRVMATRMFGSTNATVRAHAARLCAAHWHRQRATGRNIPNVEEQTLYALVLDAIVDQEAVVSTQARLALRIRAGLEHVPDDEE